MKDYLTFENARNAQFKQLYARLLHYALNAKMTLVGHHITFELDDDVPNEIPSADCLMFDHDIMGAVFGAEAHRVMANLATVPQGDREQLLAEFLDDFESKNLPAFKRDGKYEVRQFPNVPGVPVTA